MVIAQIRSENVRHSDESDRLQHSILSYAATVATDMDCNSAVISPYVTTAQERITANVKSLRNITTRQNISRTCQRNGVTRWRYRPIKVVPTICRTYACRTQHRQCLYDLMLRTSELVRHNQQLQRRISELQRKTEIFFKSKPVELQAVLHRSHYEDVSTPDSSPSLSFVDVLPADSAKTNHYDSS